MVWQRSSQMHIMQELSCVYASHTGHGRAGNDELRSQLGHFVPPLYLLRIPIS